MSGKRKGHDPTFGAFNRTPKNPMSTFSMALVSRARVVCGTPIKPKIASLCPYTIYHIPYAINYKPYTIDPTIGSL